MNLWQEIIDFNGVMLLNLATLRLHNYIRDRINAVLSIR